MTRPGVVDELELRRPELPIVEVPNRMDPEQINRWAHQALEKLGVYRVGPAGVMAMIRADRYLRDIPEEHHEAVARRALVLRKMTGQEPEPMKGVTKRERMKDILREMFRETPDIDPRDAYEALPEKEKNGLAPASFETTYFYPLGKQLREAGEIPEPGVSAAATPTEGETRPPAPEKAGEVAAGAAERVAPGTEDPTPQEEEPTAAPERSEAAPSWLSVMEGHQIQKVEDEPFEYSTPLILLERQGRGRLEVRTNGDGHRVTLELAGADEDLVSRITAVAWEEIIGIGEGP